jgi:uncharacterized coiled-coil protein SlyX
VIGVVFGSFFAFMVTPSPDISGLEARIEELEAEVASYSVQVEELQGKLVSLQGVKDELEAQLQQETREVSSSRMKVYPHPGQWLDNEDESVILMDASGCIVDETPLLSDTYDDDWTWSRHPNGYNTDLASDWTFQPSTMEGENP